MIGKIWEEIFSYADDLKARGEEEKLIAVQEIEDRIIRTWDTVEHFKSRIEKKPKNKMEELVLSIPGLEVYKDPADGQIFYEMDGRHFDKPEEVIRALIEYRSAGRKQAMTQTKIEIYKWIHAQLEAMKTTSLDDIKNATIAEKVKRTGEEQTE